ncbi:MAG TPA: M1 family aminopeptidase [Pyrinomonadaceae bacterium]|jgi:aminopeptidase N|nr:M1 family aminopeptidase [Pyrinomonadaceae bacterium]
MPIRITFLILLTIFAMNFNALSQTVVPVENGVSQVLARWRAANYSDVRYKLNITLEKGAPLMKGELEISVKITAEGAKNDLVLDWRPTQFSADKDKPFAHFIEVNNSIDILSWVVNEHLIVPKSLLKTGENVIKIQFASPVKTSGAAITRYVDKEDGGEYVYSLFVPSDASTAFPCFDQPDLKARFTLSVDTPEDWKVISNTAANSIRGLPVTHSEEWRKKLFTTYFQETKPISTYVFAFAAGDFTEFNDKGGDPNVSEGINSKTGNTLPNGRVSASHIYVRRSQAEKFKQHAAEVFRLNREGVKFLEGYFGYPYPFPKYDLVLIPEFPFGGMEHAGATFLREDSIIFPQEPTANNYISRANVIFHEAAHQWFGDTVTMRWFDDLWLKEGFAEFMAYKTLEKVMPQYNAWKVFYERNKQAAYLTDSTKGTTPIYQEIPNLSAAKSAYGNIVYRKAPSFLKQAEFYLGENKFQTAVRAFLKKHEFANAGWEDLVREFENSSQMNLAGWAQEWVKQPGMPLFRLKITKYSGFAGSINTRTPPEITLVFSQSDARGGNQLWMQKMTFLYLYEDGHTRIEDVSFNKGDKEIEEFWGIDFRGQETTRSRKEMLPPKFIFTNFQDHGYGIFLLDEKSKKYALENIQNEKDDFLRAMMWGSLWDSVREAELDPKDYVGLVIKNLGAEKDEVTISGLLGRASTAINYYVSEKQRAELAPQLEDLLIDKILAAPATTQGRGQKLTYYRSFLGIASTEKARGVLKDILKGRFTKRGPQANNNTDILADDKPAPPEDKLPDNYVVTDQIPLKTKDKFDIVTRLLILGDKDAPALLAELEKTETSDEAKRYVYAAKAGIAAAENKAKYFDDFLNNKTISESWIEAAFGPFNSVRHSELTLPYLEKALAELPNLKRNRKIFFVNGWLGAFIGGQRSAGALAVIETFLVDNPNLDKDLRLKILENADGLGRAVKIRQKFEK